MSRVSAPWVSSLRDEPGVHAISRVSAR